MSCDDGCPGGESYMPQERPRRKIMDRVRRGLGLGQRQSQELEPVPANFVNKFLTSKQAPPDIADVPRRHMDFWPNEQLTSSPSIGCKTHGICPGEQRKIDEEKQRKLDEELNRTPPILDTSDAYNQYYKRVMARRRPAPGENLNEAITGVGDASNSSSSRSGSNSSGAQRQTSPNRAASPRNASNTSGSQRPTPPNRAASPTSSASGRSSARPKKTTEKMVEEAVQLMKFQAARRVIITDLAQMAGPRAFERNAPYDYSSFQYKFEDEL